MSLQLTTGPGSLAALGISVSDIATIVSLSRRFGNWMTAASGDEDFLRFLDTDEFEILRRRGLLDIDKFNRIWGHHMALLANGKPMEYEGKEAEKVLEKFSRFTAIMVCLVSAMDAFMPFELVRSTLRQVLVTLLRTTDYGEDILASRYPERLNSWRSSSLLRGLAVKARQIRRRLLDQRLIMDGLIPSGDSVHLREFLVWLLTEHTEEYVTPSSDVAGVAVCLSELGIDILSIEGFGEHHSGSTSCHVRYDAQLIISIQEKVPSRDEVILSRVPCTTVSLVSPKEALTNFPINLDTANRCRTAWTAGSRAAETIKCRPVALEPSTKWLSDFQYAFWDIGKPPSRVRDDIHNLVSAHAFAVNEEICRSLETVFQHEQAESLRWILDQTNEQWAPDSVLPLLGHEGSNGQIWNFKMKDETKINAFSVFQAFFMGYYYSIFLKLVDTSTLRVQTVDGAWGYRSPNFLINARNSWLAIDTVVKPGTRLLRRERVIAILSELLLGKAKEVSKVRRAATQENWCVGVIEKQALLARSLVKPCRTIREVGTFVMLDVDTSGIPRDIDGIIRPGMPERRIRQLRGVDTDTAPSQFGSFKPTNNDVEDVTFHIEADWDGDPETLLLCVRYKGRRIETINPATAELAFCQSLLRPRSKTEEYIATPSDLAKVSLIERTGDEILRQAQLGDVDRLKGQQLLPDISVHFEADEEGEMNVPGKPYLCHFSAANRPRLRYYAAELYRISGSDIRITSENLEKAFKDCWEITKGRGWQAVTLISGTEPDSKPERDDWVPADLMEDIAVKQGVLKKADRAANTALRTDDIVLTLGRRRQTTLILA